MKKMKTMKKELLIATMLFSSWAAFAQSPFPTLNEDFYNTTAHPSDLSTILIPASPLKYDVLFTGGVDYVHNADGDSALAKEWQDFTGFVPINGRSDSGYVIVNHERIEADPINGDGGGMTVFTVSFNQSTQSWDVVNHPDGKYRNVDFSAVGGTGANCGGVQTSWGKVFTAEEWGSAFADNPTIYQGGAGITDTSDYTVTTFNGNPENTAIKKYQNFQYMVEVDVANAVAVRKNYNMGRYDHEGGWIASDRKTMYLTDDKSSGAVLFKFVANVAEDFSTGQLYCFKQSADGMSGTWEALSMDLNTMLNARDAAFALGATVFMRLEWVEGINDGTIFITETGRGKTQSVKSALLAGGRLANHLMHLDANDGIIDSSFTDMWGRVLRLNIASGKIETALEAGGNISTGYKANSNHLSSPDGLASTIIDGRTYLVINEDMNPSGIPANPAHFVNKLNEIYILDVTADTEGKSYSVEELTRFIAGPSGCETTGGRFTPDGSTYIVNIQHPSTSNTPPFDHSVTVAITGYKQIWSEALGLKQVNDIEGFGIYPNPASRELYLNKEMDVAIYNMEGKRVMVERKTKVLDISALASGTYIVQNTAGEKKKLIVE
jgi:secreted PhoX family phosphatase